MRALILALDRWTNSGEPPPPAPIPRSATAPWSRSRPIAPPSRRTWALFLPSRTCASRVWTSALGFHEQGVASRFPPKHGPPYETRVPAPDADGNDRGGVRLVELRVPLGTHTGWNERAPETGFAWPRRAGTAAFAPFARTEASGAPRGIAPEPAGALLDSAGFRRRAAQSSGPTGQRWLSVCRKTKNEPCPRTSGCTTHPGARSEGPGCDYLFAQ